MTSIKASCTKFWFLMVVFFAFTACDNSSSFKGRGRGDIKVGVDDSKGEKGDPEDQSSDAEQFAELKIEPATASVPVGRGQQFSVFALNENDEKVDVTKYVIFKLEPEDLAEFDLSSRGLVIGRKVGSVNVLAKLGPLKTKAVLQITERVMESLAISPLKPTIPVGLKAQFKALARYSDGSDAEVTLDAAWSASNANISMDANPTAKGLVTASHEGVAELKAEVGQFAASTEVTVIAAKLLALQISPPNPSVPKGVSQQFALDGEFSDGSHRDLTGIAVWKSSKPAFADFLDAANPGKAKALSVGMVGISATIDALSATTNLTISQEILQSIAVEPNPASVQVGKQVQFKATGYYSDGSSSIITDSASWQSLEVASASVSNTAGSKGLASGIAVDNEVIIRASHQSIQGDALLQVVKPPLPIVSIKADNIANSVSVPKTSTVQISWYSSNAVSCDIKLNGAAFDNKLVGTSPYKADQQGTFIATCKNAVNEVATSQVIVSITTPQISLTVDGNATDFSVPANKIVPIVWSSQYARSCSLKKSGVEIAATLSGSQNATINQNYIFSLSCTDNYNTASKSINVTLSNAGVFSVDPGVADRIDGNSYVRPLAIYFALDTTGSMSGNISVIKANIDAFVTALVAKNYLPKVGLIPFRDTIPYGTNLGDVGAPRFDLSSDIPAFKTYLNSLVATAGGDSAEASLIAIEESLNELQARETRPDALKIILTITDNPGHRGAPAINGGRDCTTAITKAKFNGLSGEDAQYVKFFFSGAMDNWPCSGYATAFSQLGEILAQILPSVPADQRGGSIAWPFTASGLVTTLATSIEAKTPDTQVACLDQSASVYLNNAPLFNWVAPSLADVYAKYKSMPMQKVTINRNLSNAELADVLAGKARIDMHRCCVSIPAAQAGDFSKCLKQTDTTALPFTFSH